MNILIDSTVYDVSEIREALRHLGQLKHVTMGVYRLEHYKLSATMFSGARADVSHFLKEQAE